MIHSSKVKCRTNFLNFVEGPPGQREKKQVAQILKFRVQFIFFRGPGLKIDIVGPGKACFWVLRRLNETSDRGVQFGGAHLSRPPLLIRNMSAAVDMLPRKTASHFFMSDLASRPSLMPIRR